MKYIIATLGCKVNQYETAAVSTMLSERGHIAVKTAEEADALIVNTCAVTGESSRKSRQAIRRFRDRNPDAVLAVCGCYSQVSPDEVDELGADIVFGIGARSGFVTELERVYIQRAGEGSAAVRYVPDPKDYVKFERIPAGAASGRTRALLKVEDGCDNYCAYCIIPHARGGVRSLPIDDAVNEAAALYDRGYRELIVTGIEISSYGKDLDTNLVALITAVSQAVPDMRIRLGSLEPTVITGEFCRIISGLDNICEHFHLSLQSGCDDILRKMRRKYDTQNFFEAVSRLREYFPDCGLTADLIVGFPGETREQHMQTLSFIERCEFSSMHIFPYSQRPGTLAADMPEQVSRPEKELRAKQAKELADVMEADYLNQCVGRNLSVLFETERDGMSYGHAGNYAQVSVQGTGLHGCVENAVISEVSGKTLVGIVK